MMDSSSARRVRGQLAACVAAAGLLFVSAAAAQTQLPPPTYGQADVRQDRIEELETQLRDATAENERLQYELIQAQRELQRLRGMVGELAGVNQSLSVGGGPETPPPSTTRAPAPQQRSEAAPPPAQTGSLGTLPASQLPGAQLPADAGAAYSYARELLVAGKNAEAEAAFGQFLQSFPNAETADAARFWFAFTLLARNNYQDAASNFVQYLQTTPRGPRAPEAQVRLGMALAGMGQTRQACGAFASLATRYPNAPRNVRDIATREARALSCQA
jgi:tol-pal system protein YbgF